MVAVGVAFAAVALLVSVDGAPAAPAERHYHDEGGWSLTYPGAFHLERSEQEDGDATSAEVTIASFAPQPGLKVFVSPGDVNLRAVPPLDRAGDFPADDVAFRVSWLAVGPAGMPRCRPNSRLPLRLADLKPSTGSPPAFLYMAGTGETPVAGVYHGAPRSRSRSVCADGGFYSVVAWIGPDAPTRLRTELARLITTLRFSHV